tara:strand:+ start:85 stop:294 length:210 start_codon:yes stop_codon:yes gene_type:complete
MRIFKNDRVRVVHDPYGGMLGSVVGQTARVTKAPRNGATRLVSLRFDSGMSVRCWLMQNNENNNTLAKL